MVEINSSASVYWPRPNRPFHSSVIAYRSAIPSRPMLHWRLRTIRDTATGNQRSRLQKKKCIFQIDVEPTKPACITHTLYQLVQTCPYQFHMYFYDQCTIT